MKIISWVFIIVSLGIASYVFTMHLPIVLRQRRSVAAAFEHGALLAQRIKTDSRFANVRIHGQSGFPKGLIIADGFVRCESDVVALSNLVTASQPPVAVMADIHVGEMPTNHTWPAAAWKTWNTDPSYEGSTKQKP